MGFIGVTGSSPGQSKVVDILGQPDSYVFVHLINSSCASVIMTFSFSTNLRQLRSEKALFFGRLLFVFNYIISLLDLLSNNA
jgi:hypothetical protein